MLGNNCMCAAPAWKCGRGRTCRAAITLRHDCAADIAGFITKGSGLWLIDGQEYVTSAGNSYDLPAGTRLVWVSLDAPVADIPAMAYDGETRFRM
jgi:hypothetical protein